MTETKNPSPADPLTDLLDHCRVREMSARYSAERNRKKGAGLPGNMYYHRQASMQEQLAARWKVRGDALAALMATVAGSALPRE